MAKEVKITPKRAAARFLKAMTSKDTDWFKKYLAFDEYKKTEGLKVGEKKAALAPLVPKLASYAERITRRKHPQASDIRYSVTKAIRFATREAAVEGLLRIKELESDDHRRYIVQSYITDIRRSLNATKHRMLHTQKSQLMHVDSP